MGLLENSIGAMFGRGPGDNDGPSFGASPYAPMATALIGLLAAKAMSGGFGNLGGLLAPWVVGLSVDRLHSWTIPFYITAIVYAAGALAWLAVNPDRPIAAAVVGPDASAASLSTA